MIALHPAVYTLDAPVSAVKLADRGIANIPAGSMLLVDGNSTITGLIDATWDGETYALFSVDLEERSRLTSES
jgi:hypothetical protein